MLPSSLNYKVLNSIDYIGENNDRGRKPSSNIYPRGEVFGLEKIQKKKKVSIPLVIIWVLTTISLIVSIYFCASTTKSANEEVIRSNLVDALEEVLKNTTSIDTKFLKRFDTFLYKRKGWLIVNYNINFTAWLVLLCNNSLLWLFTTITLIRKRFNK